MVCWGHFSGLRYTVEIDTGKQIAVLSRVCKCFVQALGGRRVVKQSWLIFFWPLQIDPLMPGAVGSCYGAGNGSRPSLFDQNFFPPSTAVSFGRHSSGSRDVEKSTKKPICWASITRGGVWRQTCLKNRELFILDLRQICSGPTENIFRHFFGNWPNRHQAFGNGLIGGGTAR